VIPTKVRGFLFNEWLSGAIHCISHFSDFVKVDIFYLDVSTFSPSPWYGLPILILHDPTGIIQSVVRQSQNISFALDPTEIDRSVSKGTAAIHEAYRRLRRGELIFAASLLDELRQHMAIADDWIHDRPPQAVPFSHLEWRGSAPLLEVFEQSFLPLEEEALSATLRALAKHDSKQIDALSAASGVSLVSQLKGIELILSQWGGSGATA
jgi:hypothetical protein